MPQMRHSLQGGKMKYQPLIWAIMTHGLKPELQKRWQGDVKEVIRKSKPIYKDLLTKVEGISDKNPMAHNITTAFVIIAVWLASDREISPDVMGDAVNAMLDSGFLKAIMGMVNMNSEKGVRFLKNNIKKSAAYAEKHPEEYNTWKFVFDDSLHKDGFYYHFTFCPIADFCSRYGYQEIMPALCNIDYVTIGMMHSVLKREHTIASGGDICDYWIYGDKVKDPQ